MGGGVSDVCSVEILMFAYCTNNDEEHQTAPLYGHINFILYFPAFKSSLN